MQLRAGNAFVVEEVNIPRRLYEIDEISNQTMDSKTARIVKEMQVKPGALSTGE